MLRSKKSSSSLTGASECFKSESTAASDENLSSGDIGWVGPINLRRRAKPELENERHRDISLRLSVQEVKQLPSKGRYFCEICLDRTLYARTTSKLSDGTVFWGEKFELNNLPDVSIITINLYKQGNPAKEKRNRSKGQNQFLAFVTIPLKEVSRTSELQQWLPMRSPNLIQLDHWQNPLSRPTESKGSIVNINSSAGPRFRKRSTPIACFRHSTSASAFTILNESVEETEGKSGLAGVLNRNKKKTSWSAGGPAADTDLMRELKNTAGKGNSESSCMSPTYLSSGAGVPPADNSPMPQIRVNLQYEAMDVLPLDYYGELREFIKTQSLPLIRFLEPRLTAKQKEELANCLVNIHEKLPDLSVPHLLTELLQEDLRQHNDESMIFRSNSTGSKAVECYIKLVGNEYLQQILKTSIDQLLTVSDDFEIDPSRVTSTEVNGTVNQSNIPSQVDRNRAALIRHLKVVWRKISTSTSILPPELREVFSSLSNSLEQTHGAKTAARLISSCLFLRFICPAIHGPVLFGLTTAVPESGRISRNLTLVAKVLQNLANLATFGEKERHMKTLNSFVEAEIPVMCGFLQSISSSSRDDSLDFKSDCHKFIDLGYEFAKLTSLLLSYIQNNPLPDELSDLAGILSFIDEHTHNSVLSSWTPEVITCRRYASCDSNGPLLRSRPRFSSTDSVPINPETLLQSEKDRFSNCSSTNSLVPKSDDTGINQSVFLNGTNAVFKHEHDITNNKTAPTSRHGSASDNSAADVPLFTLEANSSEENTEELIVQYQEQLRQLNACIDRVEASEVCPRAVTSYPHIMRVNGHGMSTCGSGVPILERKPMSPPVMMPSAFARHSSSIVHGRANGDDLICVSDYEIGDLTERSDDQCNSEPVGVQINRPEDDATRQPFLVGSPSLDQLAERLQELKLLLKHERQELEQVVASKTQVIQKQEQSIEQLASELDQLRRAPVQVSCTRQGNGRKLTSEANSPSSSLSSDCYASHQSDGISAQNDSSVHREFQPSPMYTSDCGVSPQSGLPPTMQQPQGMVHAHNRAQSFRMKAWPEQTEHTLGESVSRYGPNLLDLARASEGTGIPLGDLIVAKQALPIRRRFSESKLLHH